MITIVDDELAEVTVRDGGHEKKMPLASAEGFEAVSNAWLRASWDAKYVYSFSWLGRPIIQLPEDIIRIQEVIFRIKPDIIIETGVAHGGSLILYASLFKAMGRGRVVGIDVEIRQHNRRAIEEHQLSSYITLIEGSSTAAATVDSARAQVKQNETVLVLLDSNHSRDHVIAEMEAYAPLVTVGSYIVVMDGIMQQVVGGPRTKSDWNWNNPVEAVKEFLSKNPGFVLEEPAFPFNEGIVTTRVTYWPSAFVKRTA